MKLNVTVFLFVLFKLLLIDNHIVAQHWESVVFANDTFSYLPAIGEPPLDWNQPEFEDSLWSKGTGGFGYGDGDDSTIIPSVKSLYLRKKFMVYDLSVISSWLLDIDYDDGFVAYLNGNEIARSFNVPDSIPTYDIVLSDDHEANLYRDLEPERYVLDSSFLFEGINTLAIQIINTDTFSSDLSSLIYLNALINTIDTIYHTVPEWFRPLVQLTKSKLPIIMIYTNGQLIEDDPKIIAEMGVIDNGAGNINDINDPFNNYNGQIAIEVRGESSIDSKKKSYRLETQTNTGDNLNVSLAGLPEENDWILYGPYLDKSMIRDILIFYMVYQTGHYGSRYRLVELLIDNEYQGVYILMEKIKIDQNRVNISSLKPEDIAGDDLTGGYLIRVDKADTNTVTFQTGVTFQDKNNVTFQYYEPDQDHVVTEQEEYIQNFLMAWETAMTGDDFTDPDSGYHRYIDVRSFIDYMIVSEIGLDVDRYKYSTYFYKDKDSHGGKLFAGPMWDNDRAFGNDANWIYGQYGDVWEYNSSNRIYWWERLMQDDYFNNFLATRWKELRYDLLSDKNLCQFIDSVTSLLQEAQQRNFQRWPILGVKLEPNTFVGNTYEEEINYLKTWMINRLNWMDQHITGIILEPQVIIQDIENNDENFKIIRLIIKDDYFNKSILIHRYFALHNQGDLFVWDTVMYVDASTAEIRLQRLIPEARLPSQFFVTVHHSILNGTEDLISNEIGEPALITPLVCFKTKVYNDGRKIYIHCNNPEYLSDYLIVFNKLGIPVKQYHLEKACFNEISVDLSEDIYVIGFSVNGFPQSYKIMILHD